MFHSFGLTGGTLLPILSGVKTFLYPSLLHYRINQNWYMPRMQRLCLEQIHFCQAMAAWQTAMNFYRMRYIFAGAEKVKDTTR